MPFQGNLSNAEHAPRAFTVRGASDGGFAVTAQPDPLLEAIASDCLYRHGETGVICAVDARIDSAPGDAGAGPAALLAQAYLKSGRDFLRHILGDFAGAIWDPRHRRLMLFTDRSGARGVFYRSDATGVKFATDARQMALPRTGACDFAKLLDWTLKPFQSGYGGGICEQVPPGHVALFENGAVTLHRYWDPRDAPDVRFARDDDYVDAAQALLEEAVRCRLPRKLAVGCHLSSGLDSPLVAGVTAKLLAQSNRTLTAFTATHTDPEIAEVWKGQLWDEHRPAAQFAARYPNIEHVMVSTAEPDLMVGLQSMLATCGAPPLSALSFWAGRQAVAQEAGRRKIGVMVTGIFGNDTYSQPGGAALSWLLRRGRLLAWAQSSLALRRAGKPGRKIAAASFGPLLPKPLVNRLLTRGGVMLNPGRLGMIPLSQEVRAGIDPNQDFADGVHTPRWTMPRDMIGEVVRCPTSQVVSWYANAYGYDMRSPLGDPRILEFCAGLPPTQYCSNGEERWLARRLLRRMEAPTTISEERGRGIQWANWHSAMMRGRPALYASIDALEGNATARRLLDLAQMRALVDNLPSADPTSRPDLMKYGNFLSGGIEIGHLVLHLEGSNAGPALDDAQGWQAPESRTISQ